MNPWDVLKIPAETRDEREIRRAYAARVREHPPDLDPAGFRRVREAYETLRAIAGAAPFGAAHEAEPDEDPGGEEHAPPIEPTPVAERALRPPRPEPAGGDAAAAADAPLRDARPKEAGPAGPDILDAVRQAAALPAGTERDDRLWAALGALADRMRSERQLVPVWSRAILDTLDDPERPWLVAARTRVGDVVLDLLEADGHVASAVIDALRGMGEYERLETMGRAVLAARGESRADVGPILSALAAAIAIVAPNVAQALAEGAFRGAGRKANAVPDWLDLDRRLAAGEELRSAPPDVPIFLSACIDGLPWDELEGRDAAARALRTLARARVDGALRALMEAHAPDVLATADARFPPRPQAKQKEPTPVWLVILVVLALVFGFSRACARPPWERKRPEDVMRDAEDTLRELKEEYGIDPSMPLDPEEMRRKIREKYDLPDPPRAPEHPPPR